MTRIRVEDMTTVHRAAIITQAIKNVDPHAGVDVDIVSKSVSITSKLDPYRFVVAIREAGYKPHLIGIWLGHIGGNVHRDARH